MRRRVLRFMAGMLFAGLTIASAQNQLLTDPAPIVTTAGTTTTLWKDLSGYAGAYGQGANPGADVLYGTGTGTWQFTVPGSINPVTVTEATVAVAMVADGTTEDLSTYVISVLVNGQVIFTGAPSIPHQTYVGAPPIITNWATVTFPLPVPLPGPQISVTITNQRPWQLHTWLALDWIELRLNTAPGFTFAGFFRPVDNPPSVNVVNAGSAIPIKFSLGGDYGLGILAFGYPKTQMVNCSTSDPLNEVLDTVTSGGSSLAYDSTTGEYTYVWKTDKAWAGTCRELIVRLSDNQNRVTRFKFR